MRSENAFQVEVYEKHKRPYVQSPPTTESSNPQLVCVLSLIFGRHGVVQMPFLSQQVKIYTGL